MAQFTIGSFIFRTKKAALDAVRAVLNQSPFETPLEGEDFNLIRALIDLHPDAAVKLTGGCRAIVVKLNKIEGYPPQRGFWIVHEDGSEIDFSIYVPFRSAEANRRDNISWAARMAIQSVTANYKRIYFGDSNSAICELTGINISWDEAVVHHGGEWPFKRILTEWLVIQPTDLVIIDKGLHSGFENHVADAFLVFHNERAKLQVVHKAENSRLGARSA